MTIVNTPRVCPPELHGRRVHLRGVQRSQHHSSSSRGRHLLHLPVSTRGVNITPQFVEGASDFS